MLIHGFFFQRKIDWTTKFRSDIPEKYDGTNDPNKFLQIYTTTIQAARGGPQVMTNYFYITLRAPPGPG